MREGSLRHILVLAGPLAAFYAAFVLGPVTILLYMSVDCGIQGPCLRNYARIFTDEHQRGVLADTVWLGLQTTGFTLLLAYPVAYVYLRASRGWRVVIVLLLVLPLLTSSVVRTFAWIVILGRAGIVNETLQAVGLIELPLALLYTRASLVLALAQIELPLMALPIIVSLARLDPNLLHAAETLGAGRWRGFATVILPLSLPGMLSGAILVFASATSAVITHTLIGGGRMLFMPYHIYQQTLHANDWQFAAALAVVLIGTVSAYVAIVLGLMRRTVRNG